MKLLTESQPMDENQSLNNVDLHLKCEVVSAVANRMSDKFFVLVEEDDDLCIQSNMTPEEMLFHLVALQKRIKEQLPPHLKRNQ